MCVGESATGAPSALGIASCVAKHYLDETLCFQPAQDSSASRHLQPPLDDISALWLLSITVAEVLINHALPIISHSTYHIRTSPFRHGY